MKTLGIDLAAQPERTCACTIDWAASRPLVRIVDWEKPKWALGDDRLVELITDPSFVSVGVDVPFGWPVAFTELIAGRRAFTSYDTDAAALRLRRTDHFCAETAGVTPLSVSADMIAAPAMRWRILRERLGTALGRIHEV